MKVWVGLVLAHVVSSTDDKASIAKTRNNHKLKMSSRGLQASTTALSQDNLSQYALTFRQCLPLGNETDNKSLGVQQQSVLFHLCSNDTCGDSCFANYDEYQVDMDTYLSATVSYFQERQQAQCASCQFQCSPTNNETTAIAGVDIDGPQGRRSMLQVDCNTCSYECKMIANMEANGYYDAINFLKCQMIYDPSDDTNANLYAGPICRDSGSKITIGVFMDENCLELDASRNVDDYMVDQNGNPMRLSHTILRNVYQDTCISCSADSSTSSSSEETICQELVDASSLTAASRDTTTDSASGGAAVAANGRSWITGATVSLLLGALAS